MTATMNFDTALPPAQRPLRLRSSTEVAALFAQALAKRNALLAAHCIHEQWMRGEMGIHIDAMLEQLWQCAAADIPEWLPMRHVDWLPRVYEVAEQFTGRRGRSNIYLVLLDYADRGETSGIYVGMTRHPPALRFDQHKAGIRAAGSVLKRGVELLIGPVLHLQGITRADAVRIEAALAEALRAEGLNVQGGH